MPRLLSAALVFEKNQLESPYPWTMLFELVMAGAPVPLTYANWPEDIVFHGRTFLRFSADVDSLEDATSAALVHLRVTFTNVTQEFMSLLENYWAPSGDPDWQVTIWQIATNQPDQTPYAAGQVFSVASVVTDFLTATCDLIAEGVTLSMVVPKERYTASSGYQNIPRR